MMNHDVVIAQADIATTNSSADDLSADKDCSQKATDSSTSPGIEPATSINCDSVQSEIRAETETSTCSSSSSCQKLVKFAQNFSFSNGSDPQRSMKVEEKSDPGVWPGAKRQTSPMTDCSSSQSAFRSKTENDQNSSVVPGFDSSPKSRLSSDSRSSRGSVAKSRDSLAPSLEGDVSITRTPEKPIKDEQVESSKLSSQLQSDPLRGLDIASFTAAQQLLMDAVQKQLYEQCSNNWMNVQRADNNCLSKSKAERYRWCVQDGQHKSSNRSSAFSQSHVSSLKKSASMAGAGVTPVQDKLYSTVFTGASKFCCRDCGDPFNTLVDLTVHMNKTGHFRDTNSCVKKNEPVKETGSILNQQKLKRRPTPEDESQSEKVLTCMGCGHLFESLQDLSVHMIKTKHYENVPSLRMLSQKQPTPLDSNARKRPQPAMTNCSKKNDFTSFPAVFDQQVLNRPNFGLSPYVPGFNNSAAVAAAYTSLLYSSPWLASLPPSMLPSLYASSSALSFPYMYPSGLYPGPLPFSCPVPSFNEEQELELSCTKCKETFKSFQKLTEHVRETSHYPDFDSSRSYNFSSKSPPISPSNVPPSKDKSNPPRSQTSSTSNKSSSSSGLTSENHATSHCKSRTDYVQESASKSTSITSASNFDFIRSLESTIKSAISKIESPCDNEPLSSRRLSSSSDRRNNFSPFLSSISDNSKLDRSKTIDSHPSTFNRSLVKSLEKDLAKPKVMPPPSSHVTTVGKTKTTKSQVTETDVATSTGFERGTNPTAPESTRAKTGKCDIPLDLTLKRDAPAHGEILTSSCSTRVCAKSFPSGPEPNRDSSKGPEKEATPGVFSSVFKSPLQSLHDNMQNFFSLMKPKIEAAIVENGTSTQNDLKPPKNHLKVSPASSDLYKPIMMPEVSTTSGSNPLQEIYKIVNSTDLAKSRSTNRESRSLTTATSTKRSHSGSSSPVESKKSKLSLLLHDLVVLKDDPPTNAGNPLQKIQDLVENKLNGSENGRKKTTKSFERNGVRESRTIVTTGSDTNVSPSIVDSISSSINSLSTTSSAASALLSLKFSSPNLFKHPPPVNGLHRNLSLSSEKSSVENSNKTFNVSKRHSSEFVSEAEDVHDDVSLEELQLEAAFARIVSSDAASFTNEEFSKYIDLSPDQIRTWLGRVMQEFRTRGKLPFFCCRDDDSGAKRIELLCRRCGVVFDSCDGFSSHVQKHLEIVKSKEEIKDVKYEQDDNKSRNEIRGKCTIQGSVCIGPYNSFEQVLSPNALYEAENRGELKSEPVDSNVLLQHQQHRGRCSDETSSSAEEGIALSS